MQAYKRKGSGVAERWSFCEVIASHLGLKKSQVYYTLYDKIVSEGFLEPLLNKNKETIKLVKEWPEFKKLNQDNNDAESVKLALWFINNVGGIEIAKRAFNAAIVALSAMELPKLNVINNQNEDGLTN